MLPLRALVAQKAASFAKLLEGTGLSSAAYYGGHGELPLPRKLNLCVCTIEKAQAIVQHMAEAGRLSEIVAVAFDEFHLLGEGSRGATLERIIARLLLHATRRCEFCSSDAAAAAGPSAVSVAQAHNSSSFIQIVCMSATLPNVPELAHWLQPCATYIQEAGIREVPLYEYFVTAHDHGRLIELRRGEEGGPRLVPMDRSSYPMNSRPLRRLRTGATAAAAEVVASKPRPQRPSLLHHALLLQVS